MAIKASSESTTEKLIKASDSKEIEDIFKNKNISISFSLFKKQSVKIPELSFNNNFISNCHFMIYMARMFKILGIITSESYNSGIINKQLLRKMHYKILTNSDTIERIEQILIKGYNVPKHVVEEQWGDNIYIECGLNKEARFIACLVDYNVLEILFVDPHHMVCCDPKFDQKIKMSYNYPSLFDMPDSELRALEPIKEDIMNYHDYEQAQEDLEILREAIKDYKDGSLDEKDFLELYDYICD